MEQIILETVFKHTNEKKVTGSIPFSTLSAINILIDKLMKQKLGRLMVRWIENWQFSQAQRVVIRDTKSSWRPLIRGIGAPDIQGEAERAGTAQPREEKAQGDLINVYKYLMGGVKKTEAGSSQWYPAKKQWTQIEIQEIPFKHKKLFYCTLEQVAQRGCRVSVLRGIQNLTGHSPVQPALKSNKAVKELTLKDRVGEYSRSVTVSLLGNADDLQHCCYSCNILDNTEKNPDMTGQLSREIR
ncbi:LOW QUALITY PROTEIN: hypothetical protein QYF61_008693, partial [Mycteria americana]